MKFGVAIEALKDGELVYREGWNGKEQWLFYERNFVMTCDETEVDYHVRPFIMIRTVDEQFVPWTASQTDILAEDWRIDEGVDEDE